MATGNMMTRELIERFAAIVGARHALTDALDIEPYVTEMRGLWPGRSPLVLLPGSTEEVSRIMALAFQAGTAIVPQGGNTGLVGGGVPDASGSQVVVSTRRLNRIREVDTASNAITVEAGVVLRDVQAAADAADRLFPLSLGSQGTCQIGGNLSSNAGGTGVLAYGNARELCLGVEVVLPDGRVFDDLRKLKKDNTGYDLKDLFVGAEGTLGIITAAVLKLFPKPRGRELAWVGLASPADALTLLERATASAGSSLTTFELVGERVVGFAVKNVPGSTAPLASPHPWQVMMEISSARSPDHARRMLEAVLERALEDGLAADAVVTSSIAQFEALWRLRDALSESQRAEGFSIKHDISVPVAAIPEFIARAEPEVLKIAPGARVVCFGHMGDGNLHYNISEPVGGDSEEFAASYRDINRAVHAVVRSLGGSFSAEHGIGQLKRDELLATEPEVAIDLMRRIKQVIDPSGIMNPGKVI
ncbi:MAG: FAD-binding oxidoreductase [Rhizobiaceae bacterium]